MTKLQTISRNTGLKLFQLAMGFMAVVTMAAPSRVLAQISTGADNVNPGTEGNIFTIFETVANTLLLLLGAIAVIMLIIGGIRYVVSQGDSSAIESARNTILYAIIGIVVAFLAYAAVNFVTGQLEG
ncbi:MAG: pilin [Candidatus Saccharimonadales bacterium]